MKNNPNSQEKITENTDNQGVNDKNILSKLEIEKSQNEVFGKILEKITKVDFRKLAGKKFIEDPKKEL